MNDLLKILIGDCRETLKTLPDGCCQTCVTSPPYYGLRDYGHAGQLGMEKTPQEFVANLVAVFAEVWRVLKPDGTLWLNLGDSYANDSKWGGRSGGKHVTELHGDTGIGRGKKCTGLKSKDLIGIPWRVAFALQEAGWYLRSDIIWHKRNPMPESVTDRPTRSHEYIFLLSKQERYFYDAAAIREQPSAAMIKQVEEGYSGEAIKDYLSASVQDASATKSRIISQARKRIDKQRGHGRRRAGFNDKWDALTPAEQGLLGANKRDVWTVAPANYPEAHFATFPPALITPCVLAGSRHGDTVLDPFLGSGTTAFVAIDRGRNCIGCELNPEYEPLIRKRTAITPGLAF